MDTYPKLANMESSTKGKAKRRHLSASECVGLGQSSEGSHPLSQPLSVTRGSKDPNRGLYPRTPTKRRRRASDGTGQQKGITEFFPVTGVIRVSPRKAALALIKTEDGVNGEAIPKVEEEIEGGENGEIVPKEEKEDVGLTDFLEGMTEDMFGDDEEFERWGSQEGAAGCSAWGNPPPPTSAALGPPLPLCVKEEEEEEEYPVDSLPDAHYGLLGVHRGQVVPQGEIQDLPEEVLSAILGHLPAEDLYRHASLVCHQWRAVVTDPLFSPWKKLYYRYEKREREAVKEVTLILLLNHIIKKDDLCVLNMVRYMAQFKHSKRVNPNDVLQCARGHPLYPQAEACLMHRMPDLQGIEGGPNPWSAMALMLILADGVKDILDLVARLRTSGCLLTPSGISEYLWAMATLLLAMRKSGINISNRLHYNIYYVLHLMENAPPPLRADDSREKTVQVTHEQQQILNHEIQRDHVVKIMAFAGTGKTTTLVRYAQQRPHLRFLYVAFNKSVATEAQRCFPGNVECKTVHSMAFKAVGLRYMHLKKLSGNLKPFSVSWVLPKGCGGFVNAKVVTLTINTYCASTDECIGTHHVPFEYKNTNGKMEQPDQAKKQVFAKIAQDIWNRMTQREPTKESAYHMTHDGYLKLWQLQRPRLDQYDIIFIDEAQDCTPVIMDIMLSQHCGKILVGDPHQQIYTFRGAVNALHEVTHTHLYYLTQSFRFGSEIAYVGATILDVCKRVRKTLVGGDKDGSVRGEDSEALRRLTCGSGEGDGKVAILSRSNVTVFSEAVRLTDANPNCKIHIVGGVDNFGLKKILDIWILMQPEDKRRKESLTIQDYFIRGFCKEKLGGYGGLKRYATHTEDRELEAKLSVVEKYNTRIPELVSRIYACAQGVPQYADYILGTVHKAKGLEFDTVVVTDDFTKVSCPRHNLERMSMSMPGGDVPDDEWNLLYVAVTRAKRALYITRTISNILTLAGEYFLRSELASAPPSGSQPPRCSTRECPNPVGPEAALSMRRLPIRYIDGAEEGGVLCASCVEQRVGPIAFLLDPPEVVRSMQYTEERIELPINIAMLLALL